MNSEVAPWRLETRRHHHNSDPTDTPFWERSVTSSLLWANRRALQTTHLTAARKPLRNISLLWTNCHCFFNLKHFTQIFIYRQTPEHTWGQDRAPVQELCGDLTYCYTFIMRTSVRTRLQSEDIWGLWEQFLKPNEFYDILGLWGLLCKGSTFM